MEHFSNVSTDSNEVPSIDKYCEKMSMFQTALFSKVDINIKNAQERYKKDFDKKLHQKKVIKHYDFNSYINYPGKLLFN